MTNGLSICRDWLEHLASSQQEGVDPGARAKAIIDECRSAMDRSEMAALAAELDGQLTALGRWIAPSGGPSPRDWRRSVIACAVAVLRRPSSLIAASPGTAGVEEAPQERLRPKPPVDGMRWTLMAVLAAVIGASWMAFAIYSAVDAGAAGGRLTLGDIRPG